MLFEDQRSNVRLRRLAVSFKDDSINDRKMDIGIVIRDALHDRALRKADSNNQIVAALGKRAHGGLDRNWIARFNVANHNVQRRLATTSLSIWLRSRFGALNSRPGGGVERAIVLSAYIENDADVHL